MYFVEVNVFTVNTKEKYSSVIINVNQISSIYAKEILDVRGNSLKINYFVEMINNKTYELDQSSFSRVRNILTK